MSEPIRILQVVTHMNCGGLENMIMNYYRHIDRSKIQFDFLTHRPENEKKDFNEEIYALGGKIYHIPSLNPFSHKYRVALKSFFKNHNEYKIIHVHQDCMSGLILKIAFQNGVNVRIAHCHSSSQDKGIKYFIKLIYKRKISKYATKMFACGYESGKWMYETTDFEVLSNAIDSEKFRYNCEMRKMIRDQLKINNDTLVIGHVGRFCKVKNHAFIVEIVEELSKIIPNVKVLFIGQGELMSDIIQKVNEKKLNNYFEFLGLRSDVSKLMQGMDFFVLPSLYEGVPVSIIEAQAAGLKCLVSEKVPMDCAITGLVSQLSIACGPRKWAEEINIQREYARKDMKSEIELANYDIVKNACSLENFYQMAYRDIQIHNT